MAESNPEAATGRALRPGHAITLLKGGEALFAAMVEEIDAARAEVLLESYIFEFAGAPLRVAEALERAAVRKVRVRVALDGIGTGDVPAEWQARWKAAGVEWRIFNPARGWRVLMPRRWRRLHRKLAVVDGRVAFCGGINLLDDYRDPTHGALTEPRFDFAVRVTGPLVGDAHETMARLWLRLQVTREARQHDFAKALQAVRDAASAGTDMNAPHIGSEDFGAGSQAAPGGAQGLLAGLVLRDNLRFRKRIEHFYRYAIGQAKSEIIIANAYFVPGVALQRALLRAAERGVKVTLLLQGRYEYFMQHHTSRAMYGVMLAAGIEIIEYEPSFLHAKVAVFDGPQGAIATVGSSNLDPLSLLLAREANVFIRDDAFAAELREHLLAAVHKVGVRIDASVYMKRTFATRSLAWLAYGLMRFALFATRHRY
ncbi:MAG: cardiolipin synthase ClsB [Burkholderiales bacterium]|nr:cardiolipin synthase ClsB [Burkholderiales bacterium]